VILKRFAIVEPNVTEKKPPKNLNLSQSKENEGSTFGTSVSEWMRYGMETGGEVIVELKSQ